MKLGIRNCTGKGYAYEDGTDRVFRNVGI